MPYRNAAKRVFVLAPTAKDGEITSNLLQREGLDSILCTDLIQVAHGVEAGADALLLTEDVLEGGVEELLRAFDTQPPWSDIPVIMLLRGGPHGPAAARVLRALTNVTLLERPAPMRSVASAVQAAVRARRRQYEIRDQIEALRRAEERARDLQQRLEIAIDASALGTFHCALPLEALHWNETCKAHFWLPPDAEVNMNVFYSVLHPDDRDRTREAIERTVNQGEPYDIEYRTVSPQGEIRWVRATGRTYCDQLGRPARFDGTTADITKRKEAEEALAAAQAEREQLLQSERAARTEAERSGRMKDDFLATLSHELRTPLNAILGWALLLRRGETKKEHLEEGVTIIERNARAQAKLIEDLLDMNRIVSGKLGLDAVEIETDSFVEAAIQTLRPTAESKQVRLDKGTVGAPVPLKGDPNRLQQVVWNLISNAVKFTPSGGFVEVTSTYTPTTLRITVVDSGKGISREFLPFVFDRFRQADASITRSQGGLGLGLAIAKHLTELHSGSISVESDGPGKGSRFTVTLPLGDPVRAEDDSHEIKQANPPQKLELANLSLRGKRILVVDDELDGRILVKRVLEEAQAQVMTAGSAEEALTILEQFKPDLLISDIGMPELDGYEFLRRARTLRFVREKGLPAIALTAFAREEDRAKALSAGYSNHLVKPIEPRQLIVAVSAIFNRSGIDSDLRYAAEAQI